MGSIWVVPQTPVRVRMAPSPTGPLHVGNARTALYNFLFARRQGGVFILRIDDTDLERSTAEDEAYIFDGFQWLGLGWDEGPFRQSERLDIYKEHAARLLSEGHAYRCYCTPEELAEERRLAEAEKRPYRYSRRCLRNPPAGRDSFTVRLQMPETRLSIEDLIRGTVSWDTALIGDPVIVKSDGWPVYNFASPLDDALMKVTHVIRAEEHLSNTPVQIVLLDLLGYARPEAYAHLPWVLAPDRTKLSKRRHRVLLTHFRDAGYLPEAVVNYLALLGWNPGTEEEIFTLDELVGLFDLPRVQKAGAIFDQDKLDWINGIWIRRLPVDELARRLAPFLPELDEATRKRAAPALQERMRTLADARELLTYLWELPGPPELDQESAERLRSAAAALADTDWTPSAIESTLERLREEQGWTRNQLFKPIRSAVAGGNSPPIHDTLALLNKQEALDRMLRAVA